MNERIKALAEQGGLVRFKFGEQGGYTTIEAVPDLNNLERFAELVRQDEREACAKLCDDLLANPHLGGGWSDATIECSVAIRARKL